MTIELQQTGGKSYFTFTLGSSNPILDNTDNVKKQANSPKTEYDGIYYSPIHKDNSSFQAKKRERPSKTTKVYLGYGMVLPLIKTASGELSKDFSNEVTFGIVKTVGIYGKLKFSSENSDVKVDYTIEKLPYNLYYESTSTEKLFSRLGAVGGIMLNLRPITFYFGAGWGYSNYYKNVNLYNYYDDSFVKSINLGDQNSIEGIEGDVGFILNIGKFGISASVGSIEFKNYEVSAGIGFLF
jgi:hypothetical protein